MWFVSSIRDFLVRTGIGDLVTRSCCAYMCWYVNVRTRPSQVIGSPKRLTWRLLLPLGTKGVWFGAPHSSFWGMTSQRSTIATKGPCNTRVPGNSQSIITTPPGVGRRERLDVEAVLASDVGTIAHFGLQQNGQTGEEGNWRLPEPSDQPWQQVGRNWGNRRRNPGSRENDRVRTHRIPIRSREREVEQIRQSGRGPDGIPTLKIICCWDGQGEAEVAFWE